METDIVTIRILRAHTAMLAYAVEERLEVWRRTATYFRDGSVNGEIEEALDVEEAQTMVDDYEALLQSIQNSLASSRP